MLPVEEVTQLLFPVSFTNQFILGNLFIADLKLHAQNLKQEIKRLPIYYTSDIFWYLKNFRHDSNNAFLRDTIQKFASKILHCICAVVNM